MQSHGPIVRAIKTGISSIVDAHGRVLAQDAQTLYTRWSDWLVGLAALLIAALTLLRLRDRTTHPRA